MPLLAVVALAAAEAVGAVADALALVAAAVAGLPVGILRPMEGAQFGHDIQKGLSSCVLVARA